MQRHLIRTKLILFWLCAFSFTGSSHGQNFFDSYQEIVKNHLGNIQNRKVDSLISYAAGLDSTDIAVKIAHNQSIAKYEERDYYQAIYFGLLELCLYEENKLDLEDYIQVVYNVGRFYFRNQNYIESIAMNQKVVDANFSKDTKGRSYFEMGNSYWNLGDFYKALDNYKIGILHLEESDNTRLLVRCYLNLSNRYELLNTPESLEAKLEILERILTISKTTPLRNDSYATLYNSLASYYNNTDTYDFNKSKQYQLKFLSLAVAEVDSSKIGASNSNLANLYSEEERDSALVYFDRALRYQKESNNLIRTYNNLAHFYLKKGCWNDALQTAHTTFETALAQKLKVDDVLNVEKLVELSDKVTMLDAFNYKVTAYIKLYEETSNSSLLTIANQHIQTADMLIDLLQFETSEEDSKLYWREEASGIYSLGIYISHLTQDYSGAFYFSEKNKALLLTDEILRNAKKAELPKTLLEKDLSLKRTILRLEQHYVESSQKMDRNRLQEELFDAKARYKHFQDSVGIKFPTYISNQKIKNLLTLKEAQAALDEDTVVVSYLLYDSNAFLSIAFVMSITNNSVDLIPLRAGDQLSNYIHTFRNDMLTPFETDSAFEGFRNNGFQLYQILFPSEKLQSQIRDKKLLLIPDGTLQQIPFEALVTSEGDLKYLIETSDLRYAYSLSFLNYNSSLTRKAPNDFIGYASTTFSDNSLPALESTRAELESIQVKLGGEVRYGKDATLTDFLENVNKYQTIHLATHADAGLYPWVAFQDATLEAHDLYTTSNQAELIVLSACNSSVGQIVKGEGVFSLARGFFYAGANSVVATLWNVNDKASVFLMEQFYGNLKAGETKSGALREAKLTYLKSNSLSDASPYYWASFVLIGDDTPLTISSQILVPSLLIVIFLILVLVVIFLLYRRRRS